MCVSMEMILLLLFFGSVWTQEMNSTLGDITTTLKMSASGEASASLVPTSSEAPDLNIVTSDPSTGRVPEESDGTGHQVSSPSSASYMANEVVLPRTSPAPSSDFHVPEPSVSGEVATKKSSNLEINTESLRDSLELHVATDGTMVTGSLETAVLSSAPPATMAAGFLETSDGTREPSITMATSSLETSDGTKGPSVISLETSEGTRGPPATMTTDSLETSDGTKGPSVISLETSDGTRGPPATMTTDSLETSDGTKGPSVISLETSHGTRRPPATMATDSLETSDGTRGPSATKATGSLETSDVARVTPLTMSTGFLAISKGPSVSTISRVEIAPISTPEAFTNASSGDPPLGSGTNNTLLVAVLVALAVVVLLVILLVLWRRRQKRKTGALILSRGGKRNGAVDAWAGPAPASDEEALTAGAGGAGGGKGPGVSEGAGSGQQPTLTTFFDRRKSQQGSLELEELRQDPTLKGEEEPLVGDKDEAVEAPVSKGPEAGDVEAPQCL
ncbi:leukosialin [Suricata suricatta]|nr:leukosialin [Suricata suricatta]